MPSPKKPSATSETTQEPSQPDSSNSDLPKTKFTSSQIKQMADNLEKRLRRINEAYGLPPDASEWDVMLAIRKDRSILKSIPH